MAIETEFERVIKLRNELLDATRNGPVSEWIDRIGEIANSLNLCLEEINWNGSPQTVAFNVVDHMKRRCILVALEKFFETRPR